MSVQDENKGPIHRFIEFVNKNNLAPIDEFFAPDHVYHNPNNPEATDLESLKQSNAMAYSAFPDTQFTIEDLIAEGAKVVYRYSVNFTHKGEFMGIAATGKQVTITSVVISRILNG